LKKTRRGKFSEISGIFRISEIPKFGNFSEIFRKFRKFRKIPENPGNRPRKIGHFWGVYKRLQPGTTKKPPKFPPKIQGTSPTFSENFRKFPENPENPGNRPGKIVHFGCVYKRLQPETTKKPPNFPPEILGKSLEIPEIPGNSGNSREIPEIPVSEFIPPSPGKFTYTMYLLHIKDIRIIHCYTATA